MGKPLRMFRLHRLRVHYERIEKLEQKLVHQNLNDEDAAKLRERFVSQTLQRIRQGFVAQGVPKKEREAWIRKLIRGVE